jgi:anthranilate phosphoribosyltransferase
MFSKTKLKFCDIFENRLDEKDVKDYLIKLYEDGESANDIASAASAMREYLIPLNIEEKLQNKLIDNCGTGGDKSNSFNISTTVSLLLVACGSKVAKHGNRSITSKSGSADMLEALGINLNITLNNQIDMLKKTGFVFMFAQNHHPAMKFIMPIRKLIPHRTIFNIIGPLCNPAEVQKQLIGVFDKKFVPKIAEALNLLGVKRAMIVSSADGMDEISISDITYATFVEMQNIREFIIDPREYGFSFSPKEEILGGNAMQNAKITRDILNGKEIGAKKDIVLINAAAALLVDGLASSLNEGINLAKRVIDNGDAISKLEEIIKISNSY